MNSDLELVSYSTTLRVTMKNFVKTLIPQSILKKYQSKKYEYMSARASRRGRKSWSQEGEDLVLSHFVANIRNGFYVDVGAHDPFRFSNTCFFHKRGWRGLNIDPLPGVAAKFRKARPLDISLEMGVAKTAGKLKYYMFDEPALNSFDESLSRSRDPSSYRLIEERLIDVRPLADILGEFLPAGTKIDLLNIDVEGFDLEVLSSNDFEIYRPRFALVECLDADLTRLELNESVQFMIKQGYAAVAKTRYTVIFQDTRE